MGNWRTGWKREPKKQSVKREMRKNTKVSYFPIKISEFLKKTKRNLKEAKELALGKFRRDSGHI